MKMYTILKRKYFPHRRRLKVCRNCVAETQLRVHAFQHGGSWHVEFCF